MKNALSISGAFLLAWFGISEISRGVSYALDATDWSDEYLRIKATIVDSQERKWGSDGPSQVGTVKTSKSASYSCGYFLEISLEGERYRQKADWISHRYEFSRGEDCGAPRYGETVPVWVVEGYNESELTILEVGNRGEKQTLVVFAVLIGLVSLYGSFRLVRSLWRRLKGSGPAA